VAFAALLNTMVLASVFFPGTPPPSWLSGGWLVVVAFWGAGVWHAARRSTNDPHPTPERPQEDLFIRAQSEYLQGHWMEAQVLLEEAIALCPGDTEAHLLLSSVYRRSRRIDLSRRQLARLQGLAGSERWQLEIRRELALLDHASAAAA
jgi:hypothetical protein